MAALASSPDKAPLDSGSPPGISSCGGVVLPCATSPSSRLISSSMLSSGADVMGCCAPCAGMVGEMELGGVSMARPRAMPDLVATEWKSPRPLGMAMDWAGEAGAIAMD